MTIRLNGSVSGYTELDSPATGGNNTLVLPTGNGSSGQYLQTNGSGALSWAGAGKILQVVQTVKSDTFSTASGTGSPTTITGFNASITPSSTTNKILVYVNIGQLSVADDSTWGIFMFRNGTKIFTGDAAGNRALGSIAGGIAGTGATWRGYPASIMYLDSPASISAVSYTFSLGNNGNVAATIYMNRDARNTDIANDSTRTASSIILMEVAA